MAYQYGQSVKVHGQFRVVSTNELSDPTAVTFYLRKPDGTSTTYAYGAGSVLRSSLGRYYITVDLDQEGVWIYRWIGTGAVKAGSGDREIVVDKSVFE